MHRAAFVGALDKELSGIDLPPKLEREYSRYIRDLDPFDFPPIVATLLTRLGYTDVSTIATRTDEGVNILARYPARIVKFNVAVSCEHRGTGKSVVGPKAVHRLRTALPTHSCHAGILITNATVSPGAKDAQVSRRNMTESIRCVDGPALARLLFANLVGLQEASSGEFLIAPEVLKQQLISGKVRRTISSLYVPQADKLDLVKRAVEVVAEGETSPQAIGARFGYTARQGHYYATAAEALGLIELDARQELVLTKFGRRLQKSRARAGAQRKILREALRKIPAYEQMLSFMQTRRGPISYAQLLSEWTHVTHLTPTTAKRRLLTMLSWFEELGLTRRQFGGERTVVHFKG